MMIFIETTCIGTLKLKIRDVKDINLKSKPFISMNIVVPKYSIYIGNSRSSSYCHIIPLFKVTQNLKRKKKKVDN